ncbi:hypothetical protein GEMRC1_004628 [Eukaryota sp. GEM-RC1]
MSQSSKDDAVVVDVQHNDENINSASSNDDLSQISCTSSSKTPPPKPAAYCSRSQLIIATVAVVGFICLAFIPPLYLANDATISRTAAVVVLVAGGWVSEIVELGVSSLIPVVAFPLLQVISVQDVASQYFTHISFLFLGGFALALALQKANLHKRISLLAVKAARGSPVLILIAVSFVCFFLSAFISNTAAALAVLPNAVSVLKQLDPHGKNPAVTNIYGKCLFLIVAWSCSIGGIATIVGSPPNMSLPQVLQSQFPDIPSDMVPNFTSWFVFSAPFAFLFLICLNISFLRAAKKATKAMKEVQKDDIEEGINSSKDSMVNVFATQLKNLGSLTFEEKVVGVAFLITALLWSCRTSWFGIGDGWAGIFPEPSFMSDAIPAMLVPLILFFIPSKAVPEKEGEKYHRVLNWATMAKVPYNLLFLFGAGFSMSYAFNESGLSTYLGNQLVAFENLPLFFIVYFICQTASLISEVTSNTSAALTLLPIIAGLARAIEIHPLMLMVPATLSCSCAFMLISATPPNSIVFASKEVVGLKVSDMAKRGFFLSIFGNFAVAVYSVLFLPTVFGFKPMEFPDWAK